MNDWDVYLIEFETTRHALYWMEAFCEKFWPEVMSVSKNSGRVEMIDSTYYFLSKNNSLKIKSLRPDVTYSQEAVYIIIDDPERKKLDTYLGGEINPVLNR